MRESTALNRWIVLLGATLLTGCSGLSGLVDAKDEFGCPIESGINCSRLSRTFDTVEEAMHEGESKALSDAVPLPMTTETALEEAPEETPVEQIRIEPKTPVRHRFDPRMTPQANARSPEEVLALWVLPWVDTEGDLHATERVWVRVRDARWRIERLRMKALEGSFEGIEP